MATSENTSPQADGDFTRTWRYKVGLFMIIVGNGVIVLAILSPIIGVSGKLVGPAVIGGEVLSLGSIVFLGKEGFKAIKSKIFGFIKAGFTEHVSRKRHYIGVALLCTNIVTTAILFLFSWEAYGAATPDSPVWGFDFEQQGTLVSWLFIIGEVSFLIAIYVLGAQWWSKFRGLFVWKQPEGQLEAAGLVEEPT